mgnify:CR=1 FL=1
MSNGAYTQAKEIAFFRQMLPELLSKLEKSKFESRKETQKTSKTHQDFIEKFAEALWERAQEQKGDDSWNPIQSYKSHKSAAEKQQEILRSFSRLLGMKKYKNTAFQKGIKGIGTEFQQASDTIDPSKIAMTAAIKSAIDTASKIGTVATGIDYAGQIGKVGLKEFAKGKIKDAVNPIKNITETFTKIGKGGLKEAFSRIGEGGIGDIFEKIKEGDMEYADLASELAKSLEAGSKGLKKQARRGADYMEEKLEREQNLTEKLYFEPSDYFSYMTLPRNRYL